MSRAVEGTFVPDTWDWNNYQRKAERIEVAQRTAMRIGKRLLAQDEIPKIVRILEDTVSHCEEIINEPRPGTPEWIKVQEEVHHG